jgi:transposase
MARFKKKVLSDTTNKKTLTRKTTKKTLKKLDENQWRTHILAFYKSDLPQIKYLEANTIKRDPFRYRWEGSRLRELKKANATYSYAEKQYDRWFCQWKGGPKRKQLEIYVEEEDDVSTATATVDIENVDTNMNGSNNNDNNDNNDNDDDDDDDDDDDEGNGDFLSIAPQQVEEEAKKKPRIGKLQGDKMKELLIEYYLCKDTTKLLTFIRQKDLFNNKNAIARHWKDSGLEQNNILSKHVSQAMKEYDDWCVDEKKKKSETNKSNATDKKAIPAELEMFMYELIKQLALCGQGIGKKAARQIIKEALKDGIDTGDGKASFSRSTLNRFIQNYSLECKSVKNIDPARIAQVTPENRDAFFF